MELLITSDTVMISELQPASRDDFVHVRLLAEAHEHSVFVSLASDSFCRPTFEAQRFQVRVYSGLNCDSGRAWFLKGIVPGKDESLGRRRKPSPQEQFFPLN
jgi:hypothetical protein